MTDTVNSTEEREAQEAAQSVKKGGAIVGVLIVLSFIWYLMADRFTPYTSQARIEAYVVGVAPKVGGEVTQVWIKNNQLVEKGQPLYEIDPVNYEIALNKAQVDLENATRQVGAGSAAVEMARANLAASQANALKAEQDYSRLKRLYDEDPGTISVRRLEVAKASLDQARASVVARKADIERAIEQKGGEDDSDNSILKNAMVALNKAKLDLEHTVVKAPSKGIITDLSADVGQFSGVGKPVMTLIAIHDVWVNAEFTENNLGNLEAGSEVELTFDSMPGRVFDGVIRSIGLGVSTGAGKSKQAGNLPSISNDRDWLRQAQRFPVIIEFPIDQHEALRHNLRVGGQASVIAYSEESSLLKVLGMAYIRLMSLLSYAY